MDQFALCRLFPTKDGQLMVTKSKYNRKTEILALQKQQQTKELSKTQEINVSMYKRKLLSS